MRCFPLSLAPSYQEENPLPKKKRAGNSNSFDGEVICVHIFGDDQKGVEKTKKIRLES